MPSQTKTCPLSRDEIVNMYFMDHRAKLIDIAAFLDRLDRAADGAGNGDGDFRMTAFLEALALLSDGQPERARRVLEVFSDPTTEMPQSAQGMKGVAGACQVAAKDRE